MNKLAAIALAAAAFLPSPAPAGRIPDWSKLNGGSIEVRFLNGLGRCAVIYWPERAEAFVLAPPDSQAEAKIFSIFADNAGFCVYAGNVRIPFHRLRGAVAEALVRRGRAPARPVDFLSGDETHDSFVGKLVAARQGKPLDLQDRRDLIGRWVAYCAVKASPAQAEAVLATEPRSRQEPKALAGLNSTFSGCLRNDQLLPVSAPSMRGYLAEALYWRRSMKGRIDA
jgi:hypothetical protein